MDCLVDRSGVGTAGRSLKNDAHVISHTEAGILHPDVETSKYRLDHIVTSFLASRLKLQPD
jgi:hypothetical protein